MIHTHSRYYTGVLTQENDVVFVHRRPPRAQQSQLYGYVWKDGDRMDLVAAEFLGDSYAWWRITDINPEIVDPWNIAPGTAIRIPKNA